jgi:hypothetical protein
MTLGGALPTAAGAAETVRTVCEGGGAAMLATAGVAGWRVARRDGAASMGGAGSGDDTTGCRGACSPVGCGSGVAATLAETISFGDAAAAGGETGTAREGGSRVAAIGAGTRGDDVTAVLPVTTGAGRTAGLATGVDDATAAMTGAPSFCRATDASGPVCTATCRCGESGIAAAATGGLGEIATVAKGGTWRIGACGVAALLNGFATWGG